VWQRDFFFFFLFALYQSKVKSLVSFSPNFYPMRESVHLKIDYVTSEFLPYARNKLAREHHLFHLQNACFVIAAMITTNHKSPRKRSDTLSSKNCSLITDKLSKCLRSVSEIRSLACIGNAKVSARTISLITL